MACPTQTVRTKYRTPQWTEGLLKHANKAAVQHHLSSGAVLQVPLRLCHTANFVTRIIAGYKGSPQDCLQQHLSITHSFISFYLLRRISCTWSCSRIKAHVLSKVSPATQAGRITPGPQSCRLRSSNLFVLYPNLRASFMSRELIRCSFILSHYVTKITILSRQYTSTGTSQESVVRQSITESEPADVQKTPWRKS